MKKNKYNWNTEIQDILEESINDFNEIFSEYISKEEIIKRLARLEGGIEYVENNEIRTAYECDAAYSPTEKKIKLSKNLKNKDKEYIKYVLFHELTHVLSMTIHDRQEYTGFTPKNTLINIGLNEAMTEYITQLRNQKHNYKGISDYRVAVNELKNLMFLIGKNKLINCYINNPHQLKELIEKNNINFNDITKCFERIIGMDQAAYAVKNKMYLDNLGDIEGLFYKRFLYEEYSKSIGQVSTESQFIKKVKLFKQNLKETFSLNSIDEYSTYIELLCDIEDLSNQGIEENKLLTIMYNNGFSKEKIDNYKKINDICVCSQDDTEKTKNIKQLYNLYTDRDNYFEILDDSFISIYHSFYENIPSNNDELYDFYKYAAIAKYLINNPKKSFGDIKIKKIGYEFENSNYRDYFYLIITKNENDIVLQEYDDGSCMTCKKINNSTFELFYNDLKIKITLNNNSVHDMKDLNENNNIIFYEYY